MAEQRGLLGDRVELLPRVGAAAGAVLDRPVARVVAPAGVALGGLLLPRRTVLADRIQKLTEGHQVLPVGGRRQALPVGGGPRYPEWFREDFRVLLEMLRRGEINPVVAERMPLSDARRAHELLEGTAAKGKLVLVP